MRSLLLTLLLASLSIAQPQHAQPSRYIPPIEDRELYYAFFNYHQGLVNTLLAAKAANPQNSAQLDQQMAALLQMNVNELGIVIANTQRVSQAYARLAADRQAGIYTLPPNVPAPTPAQLASTFEFRRASITVDGYLGLFLQLSPASWNGLHGYITGIFKTTIYQPQ
jgi:hypothetical protein